MQKNCTGGGRCELCGQQRVAKQLCAEDGRALPPFFGSKYKNEAPKAPKKLVETPSEEGSCVKVAGGAPMWLISRGFFIADKPVLGHKKSPRPPLKSCAAVLAVAKHFRSTAQDASDRAWPRVASVRAG